MRKRGATEAVEPAALDVLPGMDERLLEAWCLTVNEWAKSSCRTYKS